MLGLLNDKVTHALKYSSHKSFSCLFLAQIVGSREGGNPVSLFECVTLLV